jgi:hypothetical protein
VIVKDYECPECGTITEKIITGEIPATILCECGGNAEKIVSMRLTTPVDAGWLKSVTEVVDKNPAKSHCQEFLRHPTRANYKNWMKGEGLRPLEPGEPAMPKVDKKARVNRIKEGLKRRWQERNAIAI